MVPAANHHVRAPFRLRRHEKAESKSLARENRRIVFRALTNARIIAMAIREFAIGCRDARDVLAAHNVNSLNDISTRNHEKDLPVFE